MTPARCGRRRPAFRCRRAGRSGHRNCCARCWEFIWINPRLTHWARDRHRGKKLPLEYVVRKQCHDTAQLFGLTDRGTIEVGKKADINVIDMAALTLHPARMAYDLPAGGRRLVQHASGYAATIVSGTVTRRDGVDTGARPGRLVRGAR